MLFFFFKQKTAYEMRISDWSSDVCSSDLVRRACASGRRLGRSCRSVFRGDRGRKPAASEPEGDADQQDKYRHLDERTDDRGEGDRGRKARSEEHTSELQSLMRISYAVFCLKKKTQQKIKDNQYRII